MVFLSTTSILQLRMSNVKGLYTDFFHQVKKCFFTNAFSNSFHSNIMNSFFKKHKTDKMFINTISKLILLSLPCLFADLKYICPIHIFMFPIFFAMQPRVVFEKKCLKIAAITQAIKNVMENNFRLCLWYRYQLQLLATSQTAQDNTGVFKTLSNI